MRTHQNSKSYEIKNDVKKVPSTREVTYNELVQYMHLPEKMVAKELGMCLTSLKKLCRQHGILRWPHRKLKSIDKKLSSLQSDCPGRADGTDDAPHTRRRRDDGPLSPGLSAHGLGPELDAARPPPVRPHDTPPPPPRLAECATILQGGWGEGGLSDGRPAHPGIGLGDGTRDHNRHGDSHGHSHGHHHNHHHSHHHGPAGGGPISPLPPPRRAAAPLYVVPLPAHAAGGDGGGGPLRMELTLPAAVADLVARGRAQLKIVQHPGGRPEVHVVPLCDDRSESPGPDWGPAPAGGGGCGDDDGGLAEACAGIWGEDLAVDGGGGGGDSSDEGGPPLAPSRPPADAAPPTPPPGDGAGGTNPDSDPDHFSHHVAALDSGPALLFGHDDDAELLGPVGIGPAGIGPPAYMFDHELIQALSQAQARHFGP